MSSQDLIPKAARRFPNGQTFTVGDFHLCTGVKKDEALRYLARWVSSGYARVAEPHKDAHQRKWAMEPKGAKMASRPEAKGKPLSSLEKLTAAFPSGTTFTHRQASSALGWTAHMTTRSIRRWLRVGAVADATGPDGVTMFVLTARVVPDEALLEIVLGEVEEDEASLDRLVNAMGIGRERGKPLIERWIAEGWLAGGSGCITVGHKWLRERMQRAAE